MKKNLNLIAQEEEPEVVIDYSFSPLVNAMHKTEETITDEDKIVLLKQIEKGVKEGFDNLYMKRAEAWVRLTAAFGKGDVARRDCKALFNAFKVVCGMNSSKTIGSHLDALSELRIAYRKLADYLEGLVLCKYNDRGSIDEEEEFPF